METLLWFELVGLVSFGMGVLLGARGVLWYYDLLSKNTKETMHMVINTLQSSVEGGGKPPPTPPPVPDLSRAN